MRDVRAQRDGRNPGVGVSQQGSVAYMASRAAGEAAYRTPRSANVCGISTGANALRTRRISERPSSTAIGVRSRMTHHRPRPSRHNASRRP